MKSFTCEVCIHRFPVALKNEHHKVPKALGGPDTPENIAILCSGCHQSLHTVAHQMVNPKRRHEVDPTVMSLFPDRQECRKRLVELALLVAKETVLKKETRLDPDQDVRITIELPALFTQLIRLAGHDMPHRNGKPSGVSRVVCMLIAEGLARRYPLKRAEIADLMSKTFGEKRSRKL